MPRRPRRSRSGGSRGTCVLQERKERKQTTQGRDGWENGTPPPHRDFKERGVVRPVLCDGFSLKFGAKCIAVLAIAVPTTFVCAFVL